VPLDEESSLLTTFLIPRGRFRYRGAHMGLNGSWEVFSYKTDKAVADLGWLLKIVDDMLVQARTLEELFQRIRIVLQRCREFGIKLSLAKLAIGEEIKFAGFLVGKNGVKPNPEKLAAVQDFPAPAGVSELRSFLGLVNQLGIFIPDLAHMTVTLRGLLKKGVAYTWLKEHQDEFVKLKDVLTSDMLVRPFDPAMPTQLLTDASRLHGVGFALLQRGPWGDIRLISCGSRSLTPAQKNYATIELEAMAIKWGIEKSAFYLKGCPSFEVVTDHKPLLGTFTKPLQELSNDRLLRFREKLVDYSFHLTWSAGKDHLIADALSRAPVFPGEEEDDARDADTAFVMAVSMDPALQVIFDAVDEEYKSVVAAFRQDRDPLMSPVT
jgi:hypothetical protein